MIMTKLMISVLIGGGLGALLGYFGKCSSGACPLTANPWRGAIYGALLGGLFYYVSGGSSPASMNKSTANIKLITEGQFDAEVVQSPLPVVVDFYATWCGPCKRLSPMLDELAGPLTSKIKFVKINVDEAPNLSQRFGIQAIPTLIFFKNGNVADKLIGLPSKDTLKTRLDSLAGPDTPVKNSG
jgi:thioredoxin 1